jgi:hypothetical protein
LVQCARAHAFRRFLLPRMPEVYAICNANHSLRGTLERILQRSRFNDRTGRFQWSRRECRQELRTLGQFFDHLYFSSDQFLGKV